MAFVGRITKENSDISRTTVDFSGWLDTGETITSVTNATITYGNVGWSTTQPPSNPAATPYDPTTLTFVSTTVVNASTAVQVFLQAGTPGSAYTVSFVVWGTSGRHKTVEIGVQLSGTPPTIPVYNTTTTVPLPSYLPLNGGTLLGPVYAYEDPLVPSEVANKHYVDTLFSTQVNNTAAEAVARAAADVVNQGSITAETTRAIAAEGTLQANINSEVTNRNTAITAAVLTETNRAEAAETTLQTNINTANTALSAETTRTIASEGTLAAGISAEVSRATSAEATLTTALAAEVTNRGTAIAAAIAAETALIVGGKVQAGFGGTNSSGLATITFATPFTTTPVVQLTIEGGSGSSLSGAFLVTYNRNIYGFEVFSSTPSAPTVGAGPIGFDWVAMVPTQ